MALLYGHRVRDEIRMTIAAYQTLYESSTAFGMRKALLAEQGKVDLQQKIEELEKEQRNLEHQVQNYVTEISHNSPCFPAAGDGIT